MLVKRPPDAIKLGFYIIGYPCMLDYSYYVNKIQIF